MMSEDGFSVVPSAIKGFVHHQEPSPNPNPNPSANQAKKKRNLPGNPDPDAIVIALSPKSLMATNRFICEICNKGFQRDQNLQLHRRGHNLPWKLKQKSTKDVRKKVYICPEKSCVHHDPARALGDLTGIKKHFSRKHGEKKWKCEKCSKKYAVQSDWKAHSKICGTREYRCDCGTLFSRKDSFITHRAFCDALAEESARFTTTVSAAINGSFTNGAPAAGSMSQYPSMFRPDFPAPELGDDMHQVDGQKSRLPIWLDHANSQMSTNSSAFVGPNSSAAMPELVQPTQMSMFGSLSQAQWLNKYQQEAPLAALPRGLLKEEEESKGDLSQSIASMYSNNQNHQGQASHMSATALLQKAAQMGSTRSNPAFSSSNAVGLMSSFNSYNQSKSDALKLLSSRQPNHHHQDDNNLNEFVNPLPSSTPVTTTIMKDGAPFFGDSNSNSSSSVLSTANKNLKHFSMMQQQANGKQNLHGNSSAAEVEGSLTRDFLGVGGEPRRPYLQHELAKFASMGAVMDSSLFRSAGHH